MNNKCGMLVFCDFDQENFVAVESKHSPGLFTFPGGKKENFDNNLKETAIREFEEETRFSRTLIDESKVLLLGYMPIDEENNYSEFFYYKCKLEEFLFLDQNMNKEGQAVRVLSTKEMLDRTICLYSNTGILTLLKNT